MLSVSTSFNFGRCGSLSAAVRDAAKLGFAGVELRAQGAAPDREAAGALCRDLRLRCRSVHAPLTPGPWDGGDPTKEIASADETKRRAAVRAVLDTLPAAAAAGAEVIVVHLGEVPAEGASARQRGWLRALAAGQDPAADVRAALADRNRRRDPHLLAAARSLFDLTRAEPDVRFAFEVRMYWNEIPSLDEVEVLLSDSAGKRVSWWHDTGHAHYLGRVGITDPLAWLSRYGASCAGLHLHDMAGETDHLPPGLGEVDWTGLSALAGAGMLRVLELSSRCGAAEALGGARHLETVGLG